MENNDPIENTVSLLHRIVLLMLATIIIREIMNPRKNTVSLFHIIVFSVPQTLICRE